MTPVIVGCLVAGVVGGFCSWVSYWTGFRDARANPYEKMPKWLASRNQVAMDEGARAAALEYLAEGVIFDRENK